MCDMMHVTLCAVDETNLGGVSKKGKYEKRTNVK